MILSYDDKEYDFNDSIIAIYESEEGEIGIDFLESTWGLKYVLMDIFRNASYKEKEVVIFNNEFRVNISPVMPLVSCVIEGISYLEKTPIYNLSTLVIIGECEFFLGEDI
jgi:hypothetical protein